MDALKPLSIMAMACTALLLSSCASVSSALDEEQTGVVYALGSREGFTSPLQKALETACPPLQFSGTRFELTGAHERTLQDLAQGWKAGKPRYLIAGYAAPGLPEDYARGLSDRRAHGVRQRLIETGVEAANLQAVGFGNDIAPAVPAADAVVIYRQ